MFYSAWGTIENNDESLIEPFTTNTTELISKRCLGTLLSTITNEYDIKNCIMNSNPNDLKKSINDLYTNPIIINDGIIHTLIDVNVLSNLSNNFNTLFVEYTNLKKLHDELINISKKHNIDDTLKIVRKYFDTINNVLLKNGYVILKLYNACLLFVKLNKSQLRNNSLLDINEESIKTNLELNRIIEDVRRYLKNFSLTIKNV